MWIILYFITSPLILPTLQHGLLKSKSHQNSSLILSLKVLPSTRYKSTSPSILLPARQRYLPAFFSLGFPHHGLDSCPAVSVLKVPLNKALTSNGLSPWVPMLVLPSLPYLDSTPVPTQVPSFLVLPTIWLTLILTPSLQVLAWFTLSAPGIVVVKDDLLRFYTLVTKIEYQEHV